MENPGCSAVGSAPALGAGCRGFESRHSDQIQHHLLAAHASSVDGVWFRPHNDATDGKNPAKRRIIPLHLRKQSGCIGMTEPTGGVVYVYRDCCSNESGDSPIHCRHAQYRNGRIFHAEIPQGELCWHRRNCLILRRLQGERRDCRTNID